MVISYIKPSFKCAGDDLSHEILDDFTAKYRAKTSIDWECRWAIWIAPGKNI